MKGFNILTMALLCSSLKATCSAHINAYKGLENTSRSLRENGTDILVANKSFLTGTENIGKEMAEVYEIIGREIDKDVDKYWKGFEYANLTEKNTKSQDLWTEEIEEDFVEVNNDWVLVNKEDCLETILEAKIEVFDKK